MRKFLLAAVAAAAIASPAMARDGSPYVGIEGGFMIVEDFDADVSLSGATTASRIDDAFTIDFNNGYDVDAIAGYDFGLFRLEGELAYKRAKIDDVRLGGSLGGTLGVTDANFDVSSERGSVLSVMANALLDLSDDDGWSGYVGGGIGRARVRLAGDRDSALAFQGIAGIRREITPNIEVGLKYRYFRTASLNFDDSFAAPAGVVNLDTRGKVRTHSLLASLIYNFYTPAPVIVEPVIAPPPPPLPAPATQTCYDGSVILATDVCPQPPMPAPAPERG